MVQTTKSHPILKLKESPFNFFPQVIQSINHLEKNSFSYKKKKEGKKKKNPEKQEVLKSQSKEKEFVMITNEIRKKYVTNCIGRNVEIQGKTFNPIENAHS